MQLCSLSSLSFLSFKQVRFYESLLAPQGSALCIPRATTSTVSAHIQGKIHFNIYLHEYFFLQWGENHKTGVWEGGREGGRGAWRRSSEREIVHSGEEKSLCYPR